MTGYPASRCKRIVFTIGVILIIVGVGPLLQIGLAADTAPKAAPQTLTTTPQIVILQALLANPITAPYRIAVTPRGKQYVLSGKVGTGQVHHAAIQTVLTLGYPVRDDLTIDTAEAHRVAAMAQAQGARGAMPGSMIATGGFGAGSSDVYPPPLFGRLDDPFFGFEPPLLSYPPWWGAVVARS